MGKFQISPWKAVVGGLVNQPKTYDVDDLLRRMPIEERTYRLRGPKSIKSIVKIEFAAKRSPTFWNQAQGMEYGWYSNENPKRPHPRWSQAYEKGIPSMERRPTLMYNGYGKYVAHLYKESDF